MIEEFFVPSTLIFFGILFVMWNVVTGKKLTLINIMTFTLAVFGTLFLFQSGIIQDLFPEFEWLDDSMLFGSKITQDINYTINITSTESPTYEDIYSDDLLSDKDLLDLEKV